MNRLILGFLGAKGSGKDTAAQYLVQGLAGRTTGLVAPFVRIGFADALYREVARAFGVTVEFLGNRDTKEVALRELALEHCTDRDFIFMVAALEHVRLGVVGDERNDVARLFLSKPRSPRFILQRWGTEYRRRTHHGHDSYWLDQVVEKLRAQPDRHFVVTDVRFENEARFIEQIGGTLVRIRRPALEAREALDRAASGTAAHPSETALLGRPVHVELLNEEGRPDSLRQGLSALLDRLAGATREAADDVTALR
jgi:hypothetical protein